LDRAVTRVLVCGGRYFDNQDRVDAILDRVHAELGITVLIQGGQKYFNKRYRRFIGADYQAKVWAEKRGVHCIQDPADWSLGKAAGRIRNSRMLRNCKPDRGIASPGQNGTEDMVTKLRAAGVPNYEVPRED
jgi:hypothetical protein